MIERPRGTHDVLPDEQPMWRFVTSTAEELSATYGYRPIQTPVFEDTELFQRTSGQGSDVVQKEMYTFADRSGRSLTLRPEATAPIARAYVEHGMHRLPQPVKLYTIASCYRYAAPQRGRYREHFQLSVEAIGSDDPLIDAEIIQLYDELLRRLGVTEFHLDLNSIGDRNCRPAYVEQLTKWLDEHDDVLDDEARQKRATSPLRVFDVDNPRVREALQSAPKIGESLCDACRDRSSRRSSVASTTTRARRGSSSALKPGPSPRSRAAGATTISSRRSAARRRPESASAPASSGCCWRSKAESR
ncbi:MAG: histidine--tRNA ligase [Actinobacteria bacterium]|nr:MAG: histidine--tRNA ligase [Actinomycetota bacterium]